MKLRWREKNAAVWCTISIDLFSLLNRDVLLTWTATYAMARGVTDLMPRRLATLPRVGAFRVLVRLKGREA